MDKENSKSASSLRRSVLAERIRLRQEWAQLKGTDGPAAPANVLKKRPHINKIHKITCKPTAPKQPAKPEASSDALRGVVALVEVGSEPRALALRAALAAMGASVVPAWSPLVTHLVWANGGCRATRAKARALASRVVSPLWVEACAASARRLPERTFPAAARDSDLPSPATLRRLLKKAEMENIPLVDLLSDSKEGSERRPARLRVSSDRGSSDDSRESTVPETPPTPPPKTPPPHAVLQLSSASSQELELQLTYLPQMETPSSPQNDVEPETRVNTAPRRALPASTSGMASPKRSRRKLFTQREPATSEESESEDESRRKRDESMLTQRYKKDLARAERMAKRLAEATPVKPRRHVAVTANDRPRIVLTGMTRIERNAVTAAILALHGKIQGRVNRRTTHILLGSCRDQSKGCNITGVDSLSPSKVRDIPKCDRNGRTLNALLGAARGSRVLYAQWALDSCKEKKWLHHQGYEVPHLKKISQKARVERKATRLMRSEYSYDVFNGMRVRIAADCSQKDAAFQLLTLCGAVVVNQNGGRTQNGRPCITQNGRYFPTQNGGYLTQDGGDHDIVLGNGENEINPKWVFDSVAAGRMRTTRKYLNSFYDAIRMATQELCR